MAEVISQSLGDTQLAQSTHDDEGSVPDHPDPGNDHDQSPASEIQELPGMSETNTKSEETQEPGTEATAIQTSPQEDGGQTPSEQKPSESKIASLIYPTQAGYNIHAAPMSNTKTRDVIKLIEADIEALNVKKEALKAIAERDGDDIDDEEKKEKDDSDDYTSAISEIRRVNWTQFKNTGWCPCDDFTQWAKENKIERRPPAIEVLIGKPKYYWQRRADEWEKKFSLSAENNRQGDDKPTTEEGEDAAGCPKEMPERIRINSRPILSFLGELGVSDVGDKDTVVFLRPYKPLIRHLTEIRAHYRALDKKWGPKAAVVETPGVAEETPKPLENADIHSEEQSKSLIIHDASQTGSTDTKKDEKPVKDITDTLEALGDFKCLVQFIYDDIMPVVDAYSKDTRRSIRFDDLWHLFKPGDDVLVPLGRRRRGGRKLGSNLQENVNSNPLEKGGTQEREKNPVWKILWVSGGRPFLRAEESRRADANMAPVEKETMSAFMVHAYRIFYDGTSFGPAWEIFEILPYKGIREITSLDIIPLRMMENKAGIRDELLESGKKFMEYTSAKHRLYRGQTVTTYPNGIACPPAGDYPEDIDGQVIVDFKEAMRQDIQWCLNHSNPFVVLKKAREIDEDYDIKVWRNEQERILNCTHDEDICDDHVIDETYMEANISSDKFLSACREGKFIGEDLDPGELTEKELILLPRQVCAFILQRRKFALLKLEGLRAVEAQSEGWDDLKLPKGHKDMVLAQALSHFRDKAYQGEGDNLPYDLVRGKGRGLVMLLHGFPGVGKTSTAECLAAKLQRPLYPITCGDLGTSSEQVDTKLEKIFSQAQKWDCVLLLDEADVFLAERTRNDIKRNALVSVFLRALEYYDGLLFLTTNRVGALDEAFKSRIHLSLYYPPLKKPQMLAIWQVNIKRIQKRRGDVVLDENEIIGFADRLWDRLQREGRTQWNGRQIRNAFQTALALADFDATNRFVSIEKVAHELPKAQTRLKAEDFRRVSETIEQFDEYLATTHGFSESQRAFQKGQRADRYGQGPLLPELNPEIRTPSNRMQPQSYGPYSPTPPRSYHAQPSMGSEMMGYPQQQQQGYDNYGAAQGNPFMMGSQPPQSYPPRQAITPDPQRGMLHRQIPSSPGNGDDAFE